MAETNPEKQVERLQQILEKADSKYIDNLKKKLEGVKTTPCSDANHTPPTILDAIETIVDNIPDNKYLFSILLTCCIKKLVDPKQDIRIGQDNMQNGYSNRTLDQSVVTPFLKRNDYTHCQASGLESGRNFERPLPWDLDYPSNPRGHGNREAFLGILNHIQVENGDPEAIALFLMFYEKSKSKKQSPAIMPSREEKISRIMDLLTAHFRESTGQGKSRLPVLALYAIYLELVKELDRFKGCSLLDLQRHTTADMRSGQIGDIQVNRSDEPFEGIEVKSEKPITADMVRELPRKFNGYKVSRYYILSTADTYILKEDEASIKEAVDKVEMQTGTQIICNALIRTLWYYLRLLNDPSIILTTYSDLLNNDEDVRPEMINAWNKIISRE